MKFTIFLAVLGFAAFSQGYPETGKISPIVGTDPGALVRTVRAPAESALSEKDLEGSETGYVAYPYRWGYYGYPYVVYGR